MAQCTMSMYSAVHEQYALCTLFKHTPQGTRWSVLCSVLSSTSTPQATPSLLSTLPLSSIRFTLLLLSFLAGRFLASINSLLPHYFSLFFNHCSFSPSSPALLFLNIPPWIVSLDPFFLTSLLNIPLHNVCYSSPFSSNFLILFPLGWMESIRWTRPEKEYQQVLASKELAQKTLVILC